MAGPFASAADVKAALARKVNQPPTTGSQGQVLTRDASSTTGTSWQTPAASGGATVGDATATSSGVVSLAGDLAGTAAAPTLKAIYPAQQTYGASTAVPALTLDVAGRVIRVDLLSVSVDPAVLDQLVSALVAKTGTSTRAAVQAIVGVGAPPPAVANTAVPVVTGTATAGSTLTSSTGAWSPAADAYTYQWYRGTDPIAAATTATYLVSDADIGRQLHVEVRAAKSAYTTSAPAPSANVTPTAATGSYLTTDGGDQLATESGDTITT